MYRFALRPRWVLSHVLVLALVVVMVNLGFWQLRRLDEKRDRNGLIEARMAEPAAALDAIDPDVDPDTVTYRRAAATGVYEAADEVLVRGRSLGGQPGVWVLTPLRTADGLGVVVNRGWVGSSGPIDVAPAEATAPGGEVVVTGLLTPTQRKGSFGATDPPEGRLATLARADVERIQAQVGYPLYPVVLQLSAQDPEQASDLPVPLEPPELTEGPHLGYAAQWFIFSGIAVVGYPLILRRQAANRDRPPAEPAAG